MRPTPILQNPALVLIVLVLTALALYRETVFGLVDLWLLPDDTTYHHGFAVVAICVFLFYRRWTAVKPSIQMRPTLSAAVLVLLASCGWLLAGVVHVRIVEQLSLLVLLGLLVVSVVGYRAARQLAFPVTLLLFAVPVWEPLRPYMQRLSAVGAAAMVNMTGIPAYLEGTEIWVAAGIFDVSPFCAGMRYLIVGTLAAALFAYINRLGSRTSVWVVAAAIGVGVLVNVLRIAMVVVVGEFTEMQHDLIDDHSVLGWILFGSSMFAYLLIVSRLIGATARGPRTTNSQPDEGAINSSARPVQTVLLSLAALALGPALAHATDFRGTGGSTAALLAGFVADTKPAIERALDQIRRR